jgi:HAD superfamily phosphatase (TIGR01668 family)
MTKLMNEIMPNEYVHSIYDINLDKLWEGGKRLLLTDLDNTLVPWNEPGVSEKLSQWFSRAREMGFKLCIISNNKGQRVKDFAAVCELPYIAPARKPSPYAFAKALQRFESTSDRTVMIGDQLFTDIRGGNRTGLYTILVVPIHPREWWGTRITRKIEGIAMKRLIRRGLVIPSVRKPEQKG